MTSENPFVEVAWRGLRVGRVKLDAPHDGTPGFLYHETPMPVGTELEVQAEGSAPVRVRVVGVVEQEGGKDGQPPPPPGMRVVWIEAALAAPAAGPAPAAPDPVPAEAAPQPIAGEETLKMTPEEAQAQVQAPDGAKPKRTRRKPPSGDPRPPRLGGKSSKKKSPE